MAAESGPAGRPSLRRRVSRQSPKGAAYAAPFETYDELVGVPEVREGAQVVVVGGDAVRRNRALGDQAELRVDHVIVERAAVREAGRARRVDREDVRQ